MRCDGLDNDSAAVGDIEKSKARFAFHFFISHVVLVCRNQLTIFFFASLYRRVLPLHHCAVTVLDTLEVEVQLKYSS